MYGIEPINSTALDFCGYSEQCHTESSAIIQVCVYFWDMLTDPHYLINTKLQHFLLL